MKLNLDCIRDILICIEDNTDLRTCCYFIDTGLPDAAVLQIEGSLPATPRYEESLINVYGNDPLIYHVNYIANAGLAYRADADANPHQVVISDLTPKGHDFLANIRNNDNWAKVKDIATKAGVSGLNAAIKIATGVASTLLERLISLS